MAWLELDIWTCGCEEGAGLGGGGRDGLGAGEDEVEGGDTGQMVKELRAPHHHQDLSSGARAALHGARPFRGIGESEGRREGAQLGDTVGTGA